MPTFIDYAFAVLFGLVFPIWGFFEIRALKREIVAGNHEARARFYLQVIISTWALTACAIGIWAFYGRPWGALGLSPSLDWRLWTGLAVTGVAAAVLVMQWRGLVAATGEKAELRNAKIRAQMESVKALLPHDRRELRRFLAMGMTAGIGEELLFRAYLIWLLSAFTGIWTAAVLSTLLFAAAHLYQGPGPAFKILFVGAAMAGLYLLSRSILLPMLLHALIDVTSGAIAFHVLSSKPPAKGDEAPTSTVSAAA